MTCPVLHGHFGRHACLRLLSKQQTGMTDKIKQILETTTELQRNGMHIMQIPFRESHQVLNLFQAR